MNDQPTDYETARDLVKHAQFAEPTPSEEQTLREFAREKTSEVRVTGANKDKAADELVLEMRRYLLQKWGVTGPEKEAIDKYQGKDYLIWNPLLRGEDRAKLIPYGGVITSLISALKRMAKTTGLVRRALSFDTREKYEAYASQLKEDDVYTTKQFESTTSRGGEISLPNNYPFRINLSITAKGYHGGQISSVIVGAPQSEGETLFPPGTKFRVTKGPDMPGKDTAYSSGKPFTAYAQLEELPDLDEALQKMPTEEEAQQLAERQEEVRKRQRQEQMIKWSTPIGKPRTPKPAASGGEPAASGGGKTRARKLS